MKFDKSKFKKNRSHQDKVADKLVDQHIKNEELQKIKMDVNVFNIFRLTEPTTNPKSK